MTLSTSAIMLRYLTLMLVVGVASARVIMDSLTAVPKGWEEVRKASPDETIFLRIALKQQRGDDLDQVVLDMSTPGHPNYGMHMTRDELRAYTSPSDATVSVATEWLNKHGIQASVYHDWVSFTSTVRTANKLLDTEFGWYQYQDSPGASPKLRALSYSIPEHVAAHIDLVQPTTRFGNLGARKSTIFEAHRLEMVDAASGPSNSQLFPMLGSAKCGAFVQPECLKTLYNIRYTPPASASSDNKVAFASFLEQYARYNDLRLFQGAFVPAATGQNFSVEMVNGGLDDQRSQSDSMEANLDVQYLHGISHPIPIMEYSTAGRGPLVPTFTQPYPPGMNEPYLEWLLYLANQPDAALPQTLSVSYGEEEQSIPREYALKVCDMFKELGARGVSVLFASGDSGPGNACVSNANNETFFEPTFPAGCPWVTAVGGTTGNTREKAVDFSSGGFSMYHEQPVWQKEVVAKYLTGLGGTYAPYFNRTGRGVPDISAQAANFVIYDKGIGQLIGGTSASTPVVAGMVALLNAARKAKGEKPLGFLNPWLYSNSAAFTDIVSGAGVGCQMRKEFGRRGAQWNATEGWDPVTGLGTPVFDKLLEAAAPGTANA